jgi:CBS domain-containing protein
MPITDFCKPPVITVTPDQKALDAVKLMRDKKVGSVAVTEHLSSLPTLRPG